MRNETLPIDQLLTMLAGAPKRFLAPTEGLSAVQLRMAPEPGEWSVVDVLAHLRSCADMWGDGIARILAEDEPTFRAINPRTWIERTDYPDLEFRPSFEAFAAQRSGLMSVLESLAPDAWARSGTVTGAGRPLRRTVHSFAERLVVHERAHIKQVERVAGALRPS